MNLDDPKEKAIADFAEKNGCTLAAARQRLAAPPKPINEKPGTSVELVASDTTEQETQKPE